MTERIAPIKNHFTLAVDESPLIQVGDGGLIEVHNIEVSNVDATDAFLQMFDAVEAVDVILGTTTPYASYLIPAQVAASKRGKLDKTFAAPLMFTKGCFYAITTTPTGNTGSATDFPVNVGHRRQRTGD